MRNTIQNWIRQNQKNDKKNNKISTENKQYEKMYAGRKKKATTTMV